MDQLDFWLPKSKNSAAYQLHFILYLNLRNIYVSYYNVSLTL